MHRKITLSAATLTLLAGCGPGLPFSQHPDPYAAQTVAQAEPLVEDCRSRFKTWLANTPVSWEGGAGPSITHAGESVSIRLEAQPISPTAIDPIQFSCQYDNGQLDSAGQVQ